MGNVNIHTETFKTADLKPNIDFVNITEFENGKGIKFDGRIKGYYASVLFRNDSNKRAELYTVGAEIQQSSK